MRRGRLNNWVRSAQSRANARAAIKRWNSLRPRLPKCGAARKYDGQPCQQLALENGKCAYHGGRVPKNREWHVRQWPQGDAPGDNKKLAAKLAKSDRAYKAKQRRLKAMTPEQRAAYDEWQRTHQPGDPKKRAAARERRRLARLSAAALDDRMDAPLSAEAQALADAAAWLRAELERRQALAAKPDDDEGVFG